MNQHQDYDKIFKENIEKIGLNLLQKLCGLQLSEVEKANVTLPRTLERRADFACKGIDSKTKEHILSHLEFQAKCDDKMDGRMLFYYALFYELYRIPVRQYVIYLGSGNWTPPKNIKHTKLDFSYEVIELNKIDYETFVNSEDPEEIILSILADFKGKSNLKVIQQIITCLKNKTKNKRKLQKLILQLEMLANLRKLQPQVIKTIEDMSLNYDIQTDLRYLQGIEQGREEAISEKQKDFTLSLLEKTDFDDAKIALLVGCGTGFVTELRAFMKK